MWISSAIHALHRRLQCVVLVLDVADERSRREVDDVGVKRIGERWRKRRRRYEWVVPSEFQGGNVYGRNSRRNHAQERHSESRLLLVRVQEHRVLGEFVQ